MEISLNCYVDTTVRMSFIKRYCTWQLMHNCWECTHSRLKRLSCRRELLNKWTTSDSEKLAQVSSFFTISFCTFLSSLTWSQSCNTDMYCLTVVGMSLALRYTITSWRAAAAVYVSASIMVTVLQQQVATFFWDTSLRWAHLNRDDVRRQGTVSYIMQLKILTTNPRHLYINIRIRRFNSQQVVFTYFSSIICYSTAKPKHPHPRWHMYGYVVYNEGQMYILCTYLLNCQIRSIVQVVYMYDLWDDKMTLH